MAYNTPTVNHLSQLADKLSKIIVANFRTKLNIEIKPDGSLVTGVDKAANSFAQKRARELGIGFVGEEGSDDDVEGHKYVLYADPLDGTSTFTAGKAEVSIVLTIMKRTDTDWVPELCVVAEPMTGWKYFAIRGGGVYQQGPTDSIPTHIERAAYNKSPFNVSVVTWRNVPFQLNRVQQVVKTHKLMHHRSSGNASINGPLIATGYIHGVVYAGRCATESAAISLMMNEVGGVATDLFGNAITSFALEKVDGKLDFILPRGLIAACSQEVAELLISIVRQAQ